MYVRFVCRSVP